MLVTFQLISPVKNAEREPKSAHEPHGWIPDSGAGAHMYRSRDMFLAEGFNKPPSHIRNCCEQAALRLPTGTY
jgi:hypothetical protein